MRMKDIWLWSQPGPDFDPKKKALADRLTSEQQKKHNMFHDSTHRITYGYISHKASEAQNTSYFYKKYVDYCKLNNYPYFRYEEFQPAVQVIPTSKYNNTKSDLGSRFKELK